MTLTTPLFLEPEYGKILVHVVMIITGVLYYKIIVAIFEEDEQK